MSTRANARPKALTGAPTKVPSGPSTGAMPGWDDIETLIQRTHQCSVDVTDGVVAEYIPVLARTDKAFFGICLAEVDRHLDTACWASGEGAT